MNLDLQKRFTYPYRDGDQIKYWIGDSKDVDDRSKHSGGVISKLYKNYVDVIDSKTGKIISINKGNIYEVEDKVNESVAKIVDKLLESNLQENGGAPNDLEAEFYWDPKSQRHRRVDANHRSTLKQGDPFVSDEYSSSATDYKIRVSWGADKDGVAQYSTILTFDNRAEAVRDGWDV